MPPLWGWSRPGIDVRLLLVSPLLPGPIRESHPSGRRGLSVLVALVVGWGVGAQAADEGECRALRQQRDALATAAMEQELALARLFREHLCPDLAVRAEGANALDGIYRSIDFGAWSRCRVEAERRLEQSHRLRYRNSQGFTYYTPEGAALARLADELRRRREAKGCSGPQSKAAMATGPTASTTAVSRSLGSFSKRVTDTGWSP
jgi:hypothetical protein